MMRYSFPKSTPIKQKWKRLREVISPRDALGIIINADPDAMASALALKRLFWRKNARTIIYHVNPISRADNMAFVRLLRIDQRPISQIKTSEITKWAIVDSQPSHHKEFTNHSFDIIIDHHPLDSESKAQFIDIRERYGSTSTIMTEYLRAAGIRPSQKLATALFMGIKTDTHNFASSALQNDINAFRYLYKYVNLNIIKKIESSEITGDTLASYEFAMKRFTLFQNVAFVHMEEVDNPDTLVIIADFFMRMVEASWSIVSGVFENKLIVILRNAGLTGDAGKVAKNLLPKAGATAGGHRNAARAEIPLDNVIEAGWDKSRLRESVFNAIKELKSNQVF